MSIHSRSPLSPVSGAPNASPDPYQSRGSTACWSKSSIDLKQLCAVDHYILIRVACDCKEHSVCCETWLCLCALLCAQEPTMLVHQVPALSLALLRGKTKGWAGWNNFFLGTIFQHSTKSFPFGVLGWLRRREQAIKLMNGRLMDFISLLRRKTRDAHQDFF